MGFFMNGNPDFGLTTQVCHVVPPPIFFFAYVRWLIETGLDGEKRVVDHALRTGVKSNRVRSE
ncbi:MAG: hypothetical protein CM1200mP18_00680 [Gammaproteobacteria bacterium]|nr:MAG: hypothetical protein CM1200mP18_00680 [Gammaproteobacteria bacterium]